MSNLKKIYSLSILLIAANLAFAQQFTVSGKAEGFAEGTWLYLQNSSPQKLLDSVRIKDGQFKLTGNTNQKINQLIIYSAQFKNYVFFWAEQNTYIELKNGEFKKAKITGSKLQDEDFQRMKLKEPNRILQDSLSKLLTSSKDETIKKELREKLRVARVAEKELDIEYVKSNPNSIISVSLLSVYSTIWGKQKTAMLYENLSIDMKNTNYGKGIKTFISVNQEIKIGGKFVDFEQANVDGKKIKLSGIKAKYTLLEFWGSWCGPCRAENPNLVKTYATYKDKGFEILGVAADENKEQWLKAIKDDKLPWENVCDFNGNKNEVALMYGIYAYPTNFLIDDKGMIIAKDLRGENLAKKLAELLP